MDYMAVVFTLEAIPQLHYLAIFLTAFWQRDCLSVCKHKLADERILLLLMVIFTSSKHEFLPSCEGMCNETIALSNSCGLMGPQAPPS